MPYFFTVVATQCGLIEGDLMECEVELVPGQAYAVCRGEATEPPEGRIKISIQCPKISRVHLFLVRKPTLHSYHSAVGAPTP